MSEDDSQVVPWSRWYRDASEEMAFRYGRRRIAADTYKEQWAFGLDPQQAARVINSRLMMDQR